MSINRSVKTKTAVKSKPAVKTGSNGPSINSNDEYHDDSVIRKSWVDQIRTTDMLYITDDYKHIDNPEALNGSLMPHQRAIVEAMLNLEQKRYIRLQTGRLSKNTQKVLTYFPSTTQAIMESTCGILGDYTGSGKTFSILSLIANCKIPKATPIISLQNIFTHDIMTYSNGKASQNEYPVRGFEIRAKFNRAVIPNLIMVPNSVVMQWQDTIKTFFPSLWKETFVISDIHSIKEFYNKWLDGTINNYTIVLAKNKVISGKFDLPEGLAEYVNKKKVKNIIDVIANITRGYLWSRLIIDDADVIKLPRKTINITARFTWMVSSTGKIPHDEYYKIHPFKAPTLINDDDDTTATSTESTVTESTVTESSATESTLGTIPKDNTRTTTETSELINMLINEQPSMEQITNPTLAEMVYYGYNAMNTVFQNYYLRNYLNIKCDPTFIDKSIKIGTPKFYLYKFKNPNARYVSMLATVGGENVNDIMEMINGDALSTAAEKVGIVTNSVADIFKKVLKDKYDSYLYSKRILGFIQTIEKTYDGLPPPPKDQTLYLREDLHNFVFPEYKYYNLKSIVTEINDKYIPIYKESSKAITRIKEQLEDQECVACAEDLNDTAIVIMGGCCGQIACEECAMDKSRTFKRQGDIMIKCMNCQQSVHMNSLLYIGKGFDLETILEEKVEKEEIKEEVIDDDKDTDKNKDEKTYEGKYQCILDLIRNRNTDNTKGEEQHLTFPSLAISKHNLPKPNDNERRFLIFANFDESLQNVTKMLDEQKITYKRLQGTYKQIHDIITKFKDSDEKVLIVNSERYCSGLNIQFATDIIFMHKIMEINTEGQVLGRCQRIGRTTELRIHYVLYDNEVDMLQKHKKV